MGNPVGILVHASSLSLPPHIILTAKKHKKLPSTKKQKKPKRMTGMFQPQTQVESESLL